MRRAIASCLCLAALVAVMASAVAVAGGDKKDEPTADGHFTCRASALRVTSPLVNSEPIVANRENDPCMDDFDQLLNVTIGDTARADVASAQTDNEPGGATSSASTANASVNVGDTTVTADVLESQASVTCEAGQPVFAGSSRIVTLVINGQPVTIEAPPNTVIDASPLVKVVINEQIQTADRLTVRAIRVTSEVLATEVVVAESIVDVHGNPCAPAKPPQCSDGIDNDGDKHIDFPDDHGCSSPEDDDESDDPKKTSKKK